jgi:hypothetical protein
MLAERSSQMTMNMHDIENKRASITKLESDLRTEKVISDWQSIACKLN